MLKTTEISLLLQEFVKQENEKIRDYKIFVRANFSLDIHIVSEDIHKYDKLYFRDSYNSFIEKKTSVYTLTNYKIFIKVYSISELEDEYVACLFSNGEAYKNLEASSRYRLNTYFERKEYLENKSREIPIITFYSYKGGMGRTTTMVSYAIDLAVNQEKKVFIIDCDLEAPGYLNFFNLSHHKGLTEGKTNGLVEFLCDCSFAKNTGSINIGNYCINISAGNDDAEAAALHNIYLMPAGNLNENSAYDNNLNRNGYLDGLSRLNLSDEQTLVAGFQTLISKVKEVINPDVILIDSRTGFNDIIGTSTMYLSDMVVGFFGYNEQTVPGLLSLLDNYYSDNTNYKLQIVSSILPLEGAEDLFNTEIKLINEYIQIKYSSEKSIPDVFPLHRLHDLEVLGTSNSSTNKYVDIIKNKIFSDYIEIFKYINDNIFHDDISIDISENSHNDEDATPSVAKSKSLQNKKTIELRNLILRNLKETLSSINSFAEITDISEKVFFYRDCMNEFFDEEKFLIRGYKGTGKTYLYKALADPSQKKISATIIERANEQRIGRPEITYIPKFIDIISFEAGGRKSFDFDLLGIGQIDDPDYYFKKFWLIHTWNSILLDSEFSDIRNSSSLSEYIKDINGYEPIKLYNKLIDSGIDALIQIEQDLGKVNEYLVKNNKKLFILYDQLDTRINPKYWDKAVSPLISYWREKWNRHTNIVPKIFVRTDLFNNNLRGTNTARLTENIIEIEWKVEEIFAYFFKLVFSNQKSAEAFWAITKKIGIAPQWIEDVKKQFDISNNQFKHLNRSAMMKAVNVFFGFEVKVNGSTLGNPWDYFSMNLANADNNSISIRPFINTLDNNAIELALKKIIKYGYVKEIIPSEIYASREVRIKAANDYFDDLAKDPSLKDLIYFKDFINSEQGKDYRYKTLDENQFEELVSLIMKKYGDMMTSTNTVEDFKALLYACGIMAFHPITGGKLYKFAPMYAYAWGLRNSGKDNDLTHTPAKSSKRNGYLTGFVEFDGEEYHCGECALGKDSVEHKKLIDKKIRYKEKFVVPNLNKESKYKHYIKRYDVVL